MNKLIWGSLIGFMSGTIPKNEKFFEFPTWFSNRAFRQTGYLYRISDEIVILIN
ncbi:hypothetical protein LEP1GSC188_2086 [Leptospira weilii serovar Topaz str. LT2116]|uniref:Uncharacterized protein n=1 Tax=Leptospira weilii serovar Topaz str. LT2116 TaxID=1088540 RepID=M3EQ19_9LEPT|nr:hypothetical protein LEP1GSC188_2086 [Leptospira weilii serovar Topaz str. LT2116]